MWIVWIKKLIARKNKKRMVIMNPAHHTYIFESGMWQKTGTYFFIETDESASMKETIVCRRQPDYLWEMGS